MRNRAGVGDLESCLPDFAGHERRDFQGQVGAGSEDQQAGIEVSNLGDFLVDPLGGLLFHDAGGDEFILHLEREAGDVNALGQVDAADVLGAVGSGIAQGKEKFRRTVGVLGHFHVIKHNGVLRPFRPLPPSIVQRAARTQHDAGGLGLGVAEEGGLQLVDFRVGQDEAVKNDLVIERREEREKDALLGVAQVLQGGGQRGQAAGEGDVLAIVRRIYVSECLVERLAVAPRAPKTDCGQGHDGGETHHRDGPRAAAARFFAKAVGEPARVRNPQRQRHEHEEAGAGHDHGEEAQRHPGQEDDEEVGGVRKERALREPDDAMPEDRPRRGQHEQAAVDQGEEVNDGRLQIDRERNRLVEIKPADGPADGDEEHEAALKRGAGAPQAGVGDQRGARDQKCDRGAAGENADGGQRDENPIREVEKPRNLIHCASDAVKGDRTNHGHQQDQAELDPRMTACGLRGEDKDGVERARHGEAEGLGEELFLVGQPCRLRRRNREPTEADANAHDHEREREQAAALRQGKEPAGALRGKREGRRDDGGNGHARREDQ